MMSGVGGLLQYLGSWEYPVSLLVEHTGLISPCCVGCGFLKKVG